MLPGAKDTKMYLFDQGDEFLGVRPLDGLYCKGLEAWRESAERGSVGCRMCEEGRNCRRLKDKRGKVYEERKERN
jgi:hypothetical protein